METIKDSGRTVKILLIEDDLGDQVITRRALSEAEISNQLFIVSDGVAALDFLYQRGAYANSQLAPKPDLVFLDLNLPKVNGRQVLETIHNDQALRYIPVLVLSTSKQPDDIVQAYKLGCKSFIVKPISSAKFFDAMRVIQKYWLEIVIIPS